MPSPDGVRRSTTRAEPLGRAARPAGLPSRRGRASLLPGWSATGSDPGGHRWLHQPRADGAAIGRPIMRVQFTLVARPRGLSSCSRRTGVASVRPAPADARRAQRRARPARAPRAARASRSALAGSARSTPRPHRWRCALAHRACSISSGCSAADGRAERVLGTAGLGELQRPVRALESPADAGIRSAGTICAGGRARWRAVGDARARRGGRAGDVDGEVETFDAGVAAVDHHARGRTARCGSRAGDDADRADHDGRRADGVRAVRRQRAVRDRPRAGRRAVVHRDGDRTGSGGSTLDGEIDRVRAAPAGRCRR